MLAVPHRLTRDHRAAVVSRRKTVVVRVVRGLTSAGIGDYLAGERAANCVQPGLLLVAAPRAVYEEINPVQFAQLLVFDGRVAGVLVQVI